MERAGAVIVGKCPHVQSGRPPRASYVRISPLLWLEPEFTLDGEALARDSPSRAPRSSRRPISDSPSSGDGEASGQVLELNLHLLHRVSSRFKCARNLYSKHSKSLKKNHYTFVPSPDLFSSLYHVLFYVFVMIAYIQFSNLPLLTSCHPRSTAIGTVFKCSTESLLPAPSRVRSLTAAAEAPPQQPRGVEVRECPAAAARPQRRIPQRDIFKHNHVSLLWRCPLHLSKIHPGAGVRCPGHFPQGLRTWAGHAGTWGMHLWITSIEFPHHLGGSFTSLLSSNH